MQISRSAVILQLVTFVAVLLPHLNWLPIWTTLLALAMVGARLMIHTGRWPFPHWLIKLALIGAGTLGLIFSFGGNAGPEAMVALLVLGLALKLIEIYHRRDALILLFVALFVLATAFLFHESVWVAAYVLLVVWLLLAALCAIHQRPGRTQWLPPFKRAFGLLLPALPLMLVLFLLFPRLEPFWSVEISSPRATTGLSDSMSPGDVSDLALSDALAFRVSFDGNQPPAPAQRYWRALVLSQFDGRSWRQASPGQLSRLREEKLIAEAEPQGYEIVMEPSGMPWLMALDLPLAQAQGQRMTPFRTLVNNAPLERRTQYRLESVQDYRLQPLLTQQEQQHYLQLPQVGNDRSRALARQWQQDSNGEPELFIRQLMNHFNRDFEYTLTPGILGRDGIDQFLFQTRRGYCEHFAGASVFLLRSAGIPARVVTGYQGGEWNTYENYLQLRQYDAHAWSEVWLEGQGWIRLDPTAAVAPERIESSTEQFFQQRGDAAFSVGRGFRLQADWARQLQLRYEAFNFAWHRWVLNYQSQQTDLLKDWLGGLDYWRMILALMLPATAVVAAVIGWQLRQRLKAVRRAPFERRLQRLQAVLGQQFEPRQPCQSLTGWLRGLATQWPEQQGRLEQLARLDEGQRYARDSDQRLRQQMLPLVDQLLRAARER
ncbi:MAG: transglutaminaseTgpA domain-containing protein [Marinobacterium sp.]